ncbi:MAG: tRNA-dihydrouridine synthase family protein [Mycoplasmataceae bacterium]|jgi:tRNA-dihydrouridine synthase B|nr:tRNA-dihydrouridine synthase family protein [Mycoplasmataceae bacterium]
MNPNNKTKQFNFNNKLFLAPMDKITNNEFRTEAKNNGADVVLTELISAKGIANNSNIALAKLKFDKIQHPIGVQLFGNNIEEFKNAVIKIENYNFDFININCGCISPRLFKEGCGAALLKRPERIFKIIKNLKSITDLPITIKIRSGIDENHLNYLTVAEYAIKAKVDAIFVHPRTKKQEYNGISDWNIIKEIKQYVDSKKLNIPIIANGDINTVEDFINIKKITKCNSFMFGRGYIKNNNIFREIKNNLKMD